MKQLTAVIGHIGSVVLLLMRTLGYSPTLPRQFPRFIEQCYLIGYTTLPIVTILSFFIGSVLALQSGYSMENFGAKQFIGSLVGLSMARELGPVMVAILIAGRVGSAITAELASMKVYQEVDALVTMNIPPERMLVLPRLAAILVMMPVLTLIGNLCGWYGGALVCQYTHFISVDSETYFAALEALHEVEGRHRRPAQGRGLRLRDRARLLLHRSQHPRRPARDRRLRHQGRRHLAHPHPGARLLRHQGPDLIPP